MSEDKFNAQRGPSDGKTEFKWPNELVLNEDGTYGLDNDSVILDHMNEILRQHLFLCGDVPTNMDKIIIAKVRPLLVEMTSYDRALYRYLTRWMKIMDPTLNINNYDSL